MAPTVMIPVDRFNKIIDVLSVLSLGNNDPAMTQIAVGEEDDLAILEHTVNELSTELTVARVQIEQAEETIEAQRLAIRALAAPVIELIKQLGVQVVRKPAGGQQKDLELIVEELVGSEPARPAGERAQGKDRSLAAAK